MKVKVDRDGDVAVVSLSGKLMGGPEGEPVREAIRKALDEGAKRFVVDLGEVSWINSTGLGILIASHVSVTNAGGEMRVARTSRKVHQLFMVTKLNTVFKTYGSVEEALADWKKGE